ncbi:MAG TPA: amidohydrolase family protein [Candidatus Deferrimicrobium sp.]|nr:amidohydrolase family protein [Candidatus Deferrimicrobium sp.]
MIATLHDQARIAGTVLLPGGRLERSIVHVDAGRISALEMDPSPALVRALRRDASGAIVLSDDEVLAPAFIDVHCHGAGGGDVLGGPAALERMAATLLRHGVGSVVATVSTAPIAQLMTAARMLDGVRRAAGHGTERPPGAEVLGLHLEGPVLSQVRSGGHDPTAFAQPADLARSQLDDPRAWQMVRIVTLAPELEGGLDLVRQLSASGVVVSVGHTDASLDVATAAYAAGARSTTHLFNGMPPLRARDPGPVGAALAAAPFVELITDGIHVDPGLLAPVARAIGDERLLLVSDALPLAGSRLHSVSTPGSSARVEGGRAVHPDGTLAGSLSLLDGMVAEAVRSGIPLAAALRAVTENPARLLGLAGRGRLEPGASALLVVVSRGGRLRRVLRPVPSVE